MQEPLVLIAAIVALAIFYVFVPLAAHTYRRYRKWRGVRCPESKGFAEIHIDARRAAVSSVFGKAQLRIKRCSLWPARRGCAERCLPSE